MTQDDFKDTTDKVSIGSSASEKDEFEELKKKRDEERISRLKLNLLRSTSMVDGGTECDLLLESNDANEPPSTPRSPASVV